MPETELSVSFSALSEDVTPPRIIYIRNSDRQVFKRCRQKFEWVYAHRGNRVGTTKEKHFWFGSAFHYAMEDRHGYQRYESPYAALEDYVQAFTRGAIERGEGDSLVEDVPEMLDLGRSMLDYYDLWLQRRDPLKTLRIDGVPQTEVKFYIPLPINQDILNRFGYDEAYFTGTIDRVIVDDYGRLWGLDYKTAKAFQDEILDLDTQISGYCWASQFIYGKPFAGFIYQQHKKVRVEEPPFLKTTRAFSTAKTLNTTYAQYAAALTGLYGDLKSAPSANIEYLNNLAAEEDDNTDKIIRRSWVYRNAHQLNTEVERMCMEAVEMIDPNLYIYPNPTKDCSWDCNFKTACISKVDGSDWKHEIEQNTIDRQEEDETWKQHLRVPPIRQRHLLLPQ